MSELSKRVERAATVLMFVASGIGATACSGSKSAESSKVQGVTEQLAGGMKIAIGADIVVRSPSIDPYNHGTKHFGLVGEVYPEGIAPGRPIESITSHVEVLCRDYDGQLRATTDSETLFDGRLNLTTPEITDVKDGVTCDQYLAEAGPIVAITYVEQQLEKQGLSNLSHGDANQFGNKLSDSEDYGLGNVTAVSNLLLHDAQSATNLIP